MADTTDVDLGTRVALLGLVLTVGVASCVAVVLAGMVFVVVGNTLGWGVGPTALLVVAFTAVLGIVVVGTERLFVRVIGRYRGESAEA